MKMQMNDSLYEADLELSGQMKMEKTSAICSKGKLWKTTGIDSIPNQVSKHKSVIPVFSEFFYLCFHSGKISYKRTEAIICTIPRK